MSDTNLFSLSNSSVCSGNQVNFVFLFDRVRSRLDLAEISGHQLLIVRTIPRNSLTCFLFLGMSINCIASSLAGSGDTVTSPPVASIVKPAKLSFVARSNLRLEIFKLCFLHTSNSSTSFFLSAGTSLAPPKMSSTIFSIHLTVLIASSMH